MTPYLFLWNPRKDRDAFKDYERVLAAAEAGNPYVTRWICPSKQPCTGDLAVVLRTGAKNNGVFARGVVTRRPFDDASGTHVVRLKLDSFLPIGREISRAEILSAAKYTGTWLRQASGTVIPPTIYNAIESIWRRRTAGRGAPIFQETHPVNSKFVDRGERQVVLEVRFNTDSMVPDKPLGTIVPKNMWDNGMVRVRANPAHGVKSQTPIHFNSFAEILLAIESTIRDAGLTMHTSSRSRKYLRHSKSYPPRKAGPVNLP